MIGKGSEWHRWEPHIHAPGTVLNNQFGSNNPWEEYLTTIEKLTPSIKVLAVTDYYLTDTYEEVLKYRNTGRIPDVQLIFPNIELRLDVAAKTGFVNIHLLVSPEDADHLTQLQRILGRLQFHAYDDRFDCTKNDLIALGKRSDPNITDDFAALKQGATQFKVNFDQLRKVIQESEWAKNNILVAVAGGSGDGTSGLRQASDTTVRQEIEKFSHIIFSSSPSQREFWLGQKSVTVDELKDRYHGCKPCLHGSDSHDLKSIGQPTDSRYSWVKGALEFDSLRQACIDPENRAFVGSEPPKSAMPSQVISRIKINDAGWANTPEIPLNPGLVAIIGARGSGKTALADMAAAGCDAISNQAWQSSEYTSPSFLARARQVIGNESVTLNWGGGVETTRMLNGSDANNHFSFPRARYLSQQFVEELCSSNGVSDGLIEEIERVILEAHPVDERDGAISFSEFRDLKTSRFQQARKRENESISDISERISIELEKEALVDSLAAQVDQKKSLINNYNSDLKKLVVKGTETQAKRHAELGVTAQDIRSKIQAFNNQKRTFIAMQDEVISTRATKAPELLRQAQERHRLSGLSQQQWEEFLLTYKGDVDSSLTGYITWADQQISQLNGKAPERTDPNSPLIAENADLSQLSLSIIVAEMTRLEALLSADKLIRDQYTALSNRINQENIALKALEDKLSDARGASGRKKLLQTERDETYSRIFEAIISEQSVLSQLYQPLMGRLSKSSGTLGKLSFSVQRVVDVESWGDFAEKNLLDLRKAGTFNGRGSLTALAKESLMPMWENGTSDEIKSAMSTFISKHMGELLEHAPYSKLQQVEYKAWLKSFAHWLFSTDHISIRYEILYDNVDIRKLSPGTRGIVLLLLYLALDDADDRPLIIDQPEENLDPKSVNDELVPLFIEAKSKRQVIMVTHNANLVINTDADQIIIAEAGPHQTGGLPPISYKAGGLENSSIRTSVCEILEGGEKAFRERARRLRVRLQR
ncbi:TrlF family AAA-like ATPase [Litoribacillus peritrichatus]|uniref:AAA family ATPase n=1 Tax=Litoribacillus peritrichatus TaxID=718191 RepID=A0ABP7MX58_9GAMM